MNLVKIPALNQPFDDRPTLRPIAIKIASPLIAGGKIFIKAMGLTQSQLLDPLRIENWNILTANAGIVIVDGLSPIKRLSVDHRLNHLSVLNVYAHFWIILQ